MDVENLTDRLNAPVQGSGADGLKLALALLWERRSECLGAVPVLVCPDEVVVECETQQAADAKVWLEKAMIEGMDAVMNSAVKACVPIEVEARIARSWGECVLGSPLGVGPARTEQHRQHDDHREAHNPYGREDLQRRARREGQPRGRR